MAAVRDAGIILANRVKNLQPPPSIGSMPSTFVIIMATGGAIAAAVGAWADNKITTRGQFLRLALRNVAIIFPILYVWDMLLTAYYKSEGWVAVLFAYLFC